MATTLKGPGLFIAQFVGDAPPFDTLPSLAKWAAALGFKGLQLPTDDSRYFDLAKAAASKSYCDDLKGMLGGHGLAITDLSTHLQGQLLAAHPAVAPLFDGFAPAALRGKRAEQQAWARDQLLLAANASANLGLSSHATFSGALLWHLFYPWPQRPPGIVDDGFKELASRWRPILDAFDAVGVDVCYELHPGEDLHDGVTFERFLEATGNHPRANILFDPSHMLLQQMDYLAFIDIYHERIRAFHVKDAEFRPNGRSGVYGGYQNWIDRPGRFRSVGDGQIDFGAIFSKFAQYDYPNWAVLEWECCLKHPEDGAREGARFIREHIIRVTDRAFDDFASAKGDGALNRKLLGL
jgi:sugar phosphate isomerase/epimerase